MNSRDYHGGLFRLRAGLSRAMDRVDSCGAAAGVAREDFDSRFLLAWLAAPFVIFSLYATQLPHYVCPDIRVFPAVAAAGRRRERPPSRLVVDKVFAWLGIVIAARWCWARWQD